MPRLKTLPVTALMALTALTVATGTLAGDYELVIAEKTVDFTGRERPAIAINGAIPGPELRWREGEEVTIRVTNQLSEPTSVHWHGILLPAEMDGVPGLSFDGIAPGETFTYRFTVRQSGTYWYHSHSGLQEQAGVYGPLVIEAAAPAASRYDRDYVVMLSDWTDEDPHRVLAKLKKQSDYYNRNQRTVTDFFRDVRANGWAATLADRREWGLMRMDPTDIADVSGYTFLLNGEPPEANWTALFQPGERVRLRFINGSAMSFFDVRIPGLRMQVTQADGQDVEPVLVDEFRIAVAETYDVIVEPGEARAYTIFAESMDRSGYARGTLAPQLGMAAEIPPLRPRQILTMADMGAAHGGGAHEATPASGEGHEDGAAAPAGSSPTMVHGTMSGMRHGPAHGAAPPAGNMNTMPDHAQHSAPAGAPTAGGHAAMGHSPGASSSSQPMHHGAGPAAGDHAAMGHTQAPQPMPHGAHPPAPRLERAAAPHAGHQPGASGGETPALATRRLDYADLRAVTPNYDGRPPQREILIRLTGNMERYFWSINDEKFSDAEPVRLRLGERVRLKFVNETMMNHPMHLHGMWMELANGNGAHNPRKHTVNVPPGQTLEVDVTADAPGQWAFHCHLLYHMETGMFRTFVVAKVVAANE